jgi:hypothetical protein
MPRFSPYVTTDHTIPSSSNNNKRMCVLPRRCVSAGVKYWAFHDRDIAPEGANLEETNAILDEIADLALELQKETGVKLLWATSNLFSHPRYTQYQQCEERKIYDFKKHMIYFNGLSLHYPSKSFAWTVFKILEPSTESP